MATTLVRPNGIGHVTIDEVPEPHCDGRDRWASSGRGNVVHSLGGSAPRGASCSSSPASYITVAVLLDFHYETFNGDAFSRMANAFYVLYSRDPHLAAVGLCGIRAPRSQTLCRYILYHLGHHWLLTVRSQPCQRHLHGGGRLSGSLHLGRVGSHPCRPDRAHSDPRPQRDDRVLRGQWDQRGPLSVHPTCNMSLSPPMARTNDLHSLVYAATALGLCYLTRNEAAAPAVLAGIVVFAVASAGVQQSACAEIWAGHGRSHHLRDPVRRHIHRLGRGHT